MSAEADSIIPDDSVILAAESALAILLIMMRTIEARVRSGQISIETQHKLLQKIELIRLGAFDAPEWKVEP